MKTRLEPVDESPTLKSKDPDCTSHAPTLTDEQAARPVQADQRGGSHVSEASGHRLTLTDFINQNHKLLSCLGIFIALAVFANNLQVRWIAAGVSFLSLTAMILVWLELWQRFPSDPGNQRLSLFEDVLMLIVGALVLYWVLEFQRLWEDQLPYLIGLVLLWAISSLLRGFNVFNTVFHVKLGEKRNLRIVLGTAVFYVVMFFSFWLGGVVKPPISLVLNELRRILASEASPFSLIK